MASMAMDALDLTKCGDCCLMTCAAAAVGAVLVVKLLWGGSKAGQLCGRTRQWLEKELEVDADCRAVVDGLLSFDASHTSEDESESAEQMRKVIAAGHLPYRALQDDPGLLLNATRFLGKGRHGALHTRFTVSYNLYAGTVVALGTQEQRDELYATQAKAELGCFAFTECGTGVMSGAAIETTATFDKKRGFVVTSGSASAKKNWISQGCFAERAVILANLVDGEGANRGPHLFWARIATRGRKAKPNAAKGVTVGSVPQKTSLQSLDNATIVFDDFAMPHGSLLGRFAEVDPETGKYTSKLPKGCARIEDVLLSRLLTGRICLSEYTLFTAGELMRSSWKYVEGRELWKGKKAHGKKMSEMSNVRRTFANYARCLAMLENFAASVRAEITACLENDKFTNSATEGACVAKFACTSFAVDVCSVLRKTLGSQGLLEESGLGKSCFVCNATCAAEGDNTVMELKVVQDIIRGRTSVLPAGPAVLFTAAGRTAAANYAKYFALAVWKGKAAIKDGQLLKDLAWTRCHLMVIEQWLAKGGDAAFLDSYAATMMRYPTPVQF